MLYGCGYSRYWWNIRIPLSSTDSVLSWKSSIKNENIHSYNGWIYIWKECWIKIRNDVRWKWHKSAICDWWELHSTRYKKNLFFLAAKYFDDSLWWVINQKRADRWWLFILSFLETYRIYTNHAITTPGRYNFTDW